MFDIPQQYLSRLSLNGLNGRQLQLPAKNTGSESSILLIYGVHSSFERMYSTAEFLADYGAVTMVDLPGIGGMNSFYSVGLEPTLDNYADYLYSTLKTLKLTGRIKVVAMSFGFLVVSRMLQKYPETEAWFDYVISFVGFGRAGDFKNIQSRRRNQLPVCRIFSSRGGGWFIDKIVFNPLGLRLMFAVFRTFNPKYKHGMATDPQRSNQMELDLWQNNDARTRFAIYKILFTFDLTKTRKRLISVPLHDLTTPSDQYFSPQRVARTLKLLYAKVDASEANMPLHAPSIIGSKRDVEGVFSAEVKAILAG